MRVLEVTIQVGENVAQLGLEASEEIFISFSRGDKRWIPFSDEGRLRHSSRVFGPSNLGFESGYHLASQIWGQLDSGVI